MNYLKDKKKVIHQFTKQLREVWEEDYPNPIRAFRMYLGFLRKYADPPKTRDKDRLTLWTPWQIDDMEMCLYNPKINPEKEILQTLILRSRRSAKTRDGTTIQSFWSTLGYDCAWRAPIGGQLAKAGFWFSRNPFVKDVRLKDREIKFVSPLTHKLDIAPLTPGSTKGGDCDCMYYDELGDVMKHLQAYILYLQSRPMVANSDFKHITNSSTPWRDTAFQDEWEITQNLEVQYNTVLSSEHTCEDCHWITPEFIEAERKNYPLWYIEAMYYCKWTVPYGAVFEKIYEVHDPKSPVNAERLYEIVPTHCGVDHNGGDRDNPHYIVTTTFDANFFYVLDEYPFYGTPDDMSGLGFLFDDKFRTLSMEIEDGLYNIQFTDQEKRMGLAVLYYAWTKEEKMARVQELRNRFIVIDKTRTPLTYKNILNAGYNKTSRLVELEKRTDQHGLDCILHSFHPSSGGMQIYERTQHAPMKRAFNKYERSLRI